MVISQIKLYELLKNKIGDKEAEAFVHIIEEKMDTKIDQRKNELATKEDIFLLKEDISLLRISAKEDNLALRTELKEDNSALRAELLRTMYLTSMGQLIAVIGSVISIIFALRR